LGVTVPGQTTTSVRSVLGIQFETAIAASDSAVLKPRLRLGWGHEFNTNRGSTVALNLLPGAPFQVTGAQPNADSLLVGAGLELELGRMLRVYGQFDGDFTGNARGYSGTGGIRLVW
jgi:outer membrane autotransporter protein